MAAYLRWLSFFIYLGFWPLDIYFEPIRAHIILFRPHSSPLNLIRALTSLIRALNNLFEPSKYYFDPIRAHIILFRPLWARLIIFLQTIIWTSGRNITLGSTILAYLVLTILYLRNYTNIRCSYITSYYFPHLHFTERFFMDYFLHFRFRR